MPDDNDKREWIVEPPVATNEISLHVAVGDGVELNAEQEAALSALLNALEVGDAEVIGHDGAPCPSRGCDSYNVCHPALECGKMTCGALICSSLSGKVAASGARAASWNLMGSFRQGLA
jgi:hypothetical protein